MRGPTSILLIIWFFILPAFNSASQSIAVQFSDVAEFYEFGKQIVFQVKITSDEQIKELNLFLEPEGQETRIETIRPNQQGEVVYAYDLEKNPLRPFTRVTYWYRVITSKDSKYYSSKNTFEYLDNRFDWQDLENDQFHVYWYQGDLSFGQMVLNVAQAGLKSAQTYLKTSPPTPLRIFVYTSTTDLQSALQLSQQSWVAGHASPDLGIILISIPQSPEQRLELERQLPHEIVHILQYQKLGDSYQKLPAWLIEGTASLAELYPNPDYQWVLERTASQNALIPFSNLCSVFPQEASGAFLAYAQSTSFVRYLYEKFGVTRMDELMQNYQDGLGCEQGVDATFGISLKQLESNWQREALGIDTHILVLQNLAPYLLLAIALLFPPIIFSIHSSKKSGEGKSP